MGFVTRRLIVALAVACSLPLSMTTSALAGDWTHGVATVGELKYPAGFDHFNYVNPEAPKGGTLKLSSLGTFDNFNPAVNKGNLATGIGLVFESLMKRSLDEPFSNYGLIAEAISYPDDYSSVSFRLNEKARWADGKPITPEDVIFSFESAKEYDQSKYFYYQHVDKVEKTGEREVKFTFDKGGNRELPHIISDLLVLPKHWWEDEGPGGKKRDISATTLEAVMGSGPYKIARVNAGSTLRYELRDDYWGKDLNVNLGYNNFQNIDYTFFSDRNVEFEAFKGGSTDFWAENEAKRWATAYDFPAANDGRIKRESLDNDDRDTGVMVGFVYNTRRPEFQDVRVRRALNYAFDFEELNRTIFYGQYKRVDSYFYGTELASSGLPTGKELEILNEVKDKIDPRILTEEYNNPVGGTPQKFRDNLRKAIGLFKEAGYELRGNKMVNAKTGKPFSFEIMLNTPIIERVALPFAANLRKIGVTATVRSVDASQYQERARNRDFDVIYWAWGESLNPGNEQAEYWGSKSAQTPGTQNYAGISDPAIDTVISKVIFAPDIESQHAAVKALDRLLLWGNYTLPSYTIRSTRLAYWDKFARPEELPYYSIGFPSIWWAKQ